MSLVAGIDSSTQACTIVLRDADDGRVVATAEAPHPPASPPVSEQAPEAMDIATDGSVWVLAWPPDHVGDYGHIDSDDMTHPVYVITPEAVAATE